MLEQPLHHVYHLTDVLRGPWIVPRRQNVQPRLVFMESLSVKMGDLVGSLALFQGRQNHPIAPLLQHLLTHVAHVGDVLDMDNLVA